MAVPTFPVWPLCGHLAPGSAGSLSWGSARRGLAGQALWATEAILAFSSAVLGQRRRRREDCFMVLGALGGVIRLNAQGPSSGHLGGFREADAGISHNVRSEGLNMNRNMPVRPILGAGAKPLLFL